MVHFDFCAVLQSFIVCRSVKLMAKISTFITLLKVLAILFIVVVGIAGVIKRGIHICNVFFALGESFLCRAFFK